MAQSCIGDKQYCCKQKIHDHVVVMQEGKKSKTILLARFSLLQNMNNSALALKKDWRDLNLHVFYSNYISYFLKYTVSLYKLTLQLLQATFHRTREEKVFL